MFKTIFTFRLNMPLRRSSLDPPPSVSRPTRESSSPQRRELLHLLWSPPLLRRYIYIRQTEKFIHRQINIQGLPDIQRDRLINNDIQILKLIQTQTDIHKQTDRRMYIKYTHRQRNKYVHKTERQIQKDRQTLTIEQLDIDRYVSFRLSVYFISMLMYFTQFFVDFNSY